MAKDDDKVSAEVKAKTDHPGKAEKYEILDKNGTRRDYASSKEKAEAKIEQLEKARPDVKPFTFRAADGSDDE